MIINLCFKDNISLLIHISLFILSRHDPYVRHHVLGARLRPAHPCLQPPQVSFNKVVGLFYSYSRCLLLMRALNRHRRHPSSYVLGNGRGRRTGSGEGDAWEGAGEGFYTGYHFVFVEIYVYYICIYIICMCVCVCVCVYIYIYIFSRLRRLRRLRRLIA